MKIQGCLLFFVCLINSSIAQIGIGTIAPEGALDITSTNTGVLFPRINLSSLSTEMPVINPKGGNLINGTLIWNQTDDQSKNISPGLYFWNNAQWHKLAVESNNFVYSQTSNQVPYLNGNTCGNSQLASNNPYTHISNNKIITIGLNVSGLTGVICNMNIVIKLRHRIFKQVSMYLMSPGGKVIKLTTGNGNLSANSFVSSSENSVKVIINFNDQSASSITAFDGEYNRTNPEFVYNFKPEGSLENDILSLYDFMLANVTLLSDFNDINPNGIWRLYVKDINITDLENYNLYIEDVKLNIGTYPGKLPDKFILLSEKKINSADVNYIIAQSEYNAQATSNIIQTIITRRKTPIQTTSINNFPSDVEILSSGTNSTYSNIRWTAVSNKSVNNVDKDTDYYYQLWRKAEVVTPVAQNENFSFALKTEY